MASPRDLKLVSQGIFNPPADSPQLVAACPTNDLTAAAGGGNAVYIRRRGGEIVSTLTERNKQVQAVAWKADGQYLAIAWSDGVVRLAGLESPKTIHQIRLFEGASAPSAIVFISWSKNLVGGPEAWQGRFVEGLAKSESSGTSDLPQVLMFLEAEDDLPSLPPLPVSGGSGDDMFVFSTRTSLGFMFPPLHPSDRYSIHVMVLGTEDGAIHVSIYDMFVMGVFKVGLPPRPGVPADGDDDNQPLLRLRRHASHPASSTHALLLANEDRDKNAVYLAPMDFSFIFSSPLNLSLLAYKTATFQKLVRYIKQTQIHMQGEWQSARELPSRFLAGIQEDLQEKEPRYKKIDHALRVAAVTGYVCPTLKTWLVETIAERGHKRWAKAVVSGLENLRDLIHDNLMPALDRATLTLSRLRGLAEFHSSDGIGFTAAQISRVMDTLSCLILVSHNAMALVSAELELFMAFSSWLRLLIERLALPAQAEENADKVPPMSVTPVIDYISNHLLNSPLDVHFGPTCEAEWAQDWKVLEEYDGELMGKLEGEIQKIDGLEVDVDMLRILERGPAAASTKGKEPQVPAAGKSARITEQEGAPYMRAFPKYAFLAKLFAMQADQVLKDIAQSGQQHVHFGPLVRLCVRSAVKAAEMAMEAVVKADQEESVDAQVFTALTSVEQPRNLHLFRTSITTARGVSTAVSTQACTLTLDGDGAVTDFRFVGSNALLVLWTWTAKGRPPRLLVVPVKSDRLPYVHYEDETNVPTIQLNCAGSQGGAAADGLCWTVDVPPPTAEDSRAGRVVRMEVLAGEGRSSNKTDTDSVRVCLMHADGATYRVFVLTDGFAK